MSVTTSLASGSRSNHHQWHLTRPPNVIGQLTGETSPDQIFLIGAHLDDMPTGAIAPGADDNASGSAAVLVAADILSQYRWGCTLRFALWTGEEQGLLGSAAYAQRSRSQSENIAGVLNLDMIAWNTAGSTPDIDLHAKSTLPATVDLANQFKSVITAYGLNLVPEVITNGSGASDHASFWNQSYPAILAIEDYYGTYDFNPYYHKVTDRLDKFNADYFTDLVKASVGDFAHMSGCLLTGALDGRSHRQPRRLGGRGRVDHHDRDTRPLVLPPARMARGTTAAPCLPRPTTSRPRPTAICRRPSLTSHSQRTA